VELHHCLLRKRRQAAAVAEVRGLEAAAAKLRTDAGRLNALLAENSWQRNELASATASLRAEVASALEVGRSFTCNTRAGL
jgi:hypothetical protein